MTALARSVDALLEATVVPSFSRIGPAVRARLDHWRPLDAYDLSGRSVLVTGATSGLGRHTALRLAQRGATVVLNGRDTAKTGRVVAEIAARVGPDRVSSVVADLAEPRQVTRLAAEVRERCPVLHALVHNAGALVAGRSTNADGVEATVAAQVVGPFVLTSLLLPSLQAAAPGRVITVASGGMYTAPLTVDELQMPADSYRGSVQYARAKRAQVTLNELWAERVTPAEIVFHSMHPGWADTPGVERSLPRFRRLTRPLLRDVEQGADTIVWLVADDAPAASSGGFWLDRRRRPIHRTARTRTSDTPERRGQLWRWCAEQAAPYTAAPS